MLTIYHNPRCRKCREALDYISDKGIEVKIADYLKNPLGIKELKQLLIKLNKKPAEMVRTKEAVYKGELKGRTFTDEEWLKILTENPKLIRRPIVEGRYKALVAQPPHLIDGLL